MELYILSKTDLSILSIAKLADYELNLDEETNSKSTFKIIKTDGLAEGNFLVLNGLYKQFLFVIASDGVSSDKGSNVCTVTALDISNIFDRKIIEKDTDTMTTDSIEEFLANMMSENFVNSDDTILNIGYIDINWNTATQGIVDTEAQNGLYNFHTFLTNCRQNKNIYTEFKIENKRLVIDITNKEEDTVLVDTTLSEVVDYNKVYETDVTAKVEVYIREDGSTYNLYLKTDRTTTTNKNDVDRASGKIEVISVDTADKAEEEALNVIKGNSYNHLVEFKIAKSSKLMDISKLTIGRPILIKTDDDIYSSYISAITIKDENFVYFKSGNLRITLLDKIKKNTQSGGNKFDVTGGKITGSIDVEGDITKNGEDITQRHIMTIDCTRHIQTFNSAWVHSKITNMDLKNSVGSKLTFDSTNNAIKIGKGVSKILINAESTFNCNVNNTDRFFAIFNNEIGVSEQPYFSYVSGNYWSFNVTQELVDVSENDLITLRAGTGSSLADCEFLHAILTVQVIE